MSGRTLLIDDELAVCEFLTTALQKRGYQVEARTSPEEALELIKSEDYDVILTDLQMPRMGGIELCERIVANRPDTPVVVITAFGSMEAAISAIRAGAYDFITKPFEVAALCLTLDRAIRHKELRCELQRLRTVVGESLRFEEMVGTSGAIRKVYDVIERVAEVDSSVMIVGESGTGKELAARALHRRSGRRDHPFVALNCAALPEALLESELFGHRAGAFTDARSARAGLFVRAEGGTIFLDEVGDMPLTLQPKLLRALQERTVRPVGGDDEVPFNARIVTATNRDLESLVEERLFREDLYYRINVVRIDLPPLRSRSMDILLLAQHFITHHSKMTGRKVTGLSIAAAERFMTYGWPGNVRELQNCVERAIALTHFNEISVEDLPEKIRKYERAHVVVATDDPAEYLTLEEVERQYILRVLESVRGNKTLAARILGVDRATLYRKLGRYDTVGN